MFKRYIAGLLVMVLLSASLPVMASDTSNVGINRVIDAAYVEHISLNKSANDEKVDFVTLEEYKDGSGFVIPKGTVFTGRIHGLKKSRWAFRRAKAGIKITEMRTPDGRTYQVTGATKRNKLKGSAVGNVAKGLVTCPVALVVGVGGSVAMLFEAVTIIGIPFLVPTGVIFGGIMGKLTNGVDYKRDKGAEIPLKINKIKHVDTSYGNSYQGSYPEEYMNYDY